MSQAAAQVVRHQSCDRSGPRSFVLAESDLGERHYFADPAVYFEHFDGFGWHVVVQMGADQ